MSIVALTGAVQPSPHHRCLFCRKPVVRKHRHSATYRAKVNDVAQRRLFAHLRRLSDVSNRRILLKNPLFWRQHLGFVAMSARQIPGSSPHVAKMGVGSGMSFASFRRFWAVGGQQELIFGSTRPTQAQSIQPEDALQMSEEHLDLLSFAT